MSLFEAVSDKDDCVRDVVLSSLYTLGVHEPVMLLESSHAFLSARHAKLPSSHRAVLLNVMRKICAESLSRIPDGLLALIVNLGAQEITHSKDVVEDGQSVAAGSSLLTVLCRRNCALVVECLLRKFQPGAQQAHPYILHTLGDVAVTNASGFVMFLSDILSRTVPMLHSIKQDSIRYTFVVAVKKFCESVLECTANQSAETEGGVVVKKSTFAAQFAAAYDVFQGVWLQTKDSKTKGAVVECLGELCHVMSNDKVREEARRLLPQMVSRLRKGCDPLPVILGLSRLLEATIGDGQLISLDACTELWSVLFSQVAVDPDRVDTDLARCQNEALRCYHVTATAYSDKLIYYLIQKLQASHEKTRISALIILRHLVNSSGAYIEDKKSLIILALKNVVADPNNRVKKYLCHLILALGDHGYLADENGHLLVEFVAKQMALAEEDKPVGDSEVSNRALRFQCAQALHSLASNVASAENVLWPFLFEYLCVESFTLALPDLCRSLVALAQRLNAENRLAIVYTDANDRLPGSHPILARLLVLLGVFEPKQRRMTSSALLLREMAQFFYPALRTAWDHEIVSLLSILDETSNDKEARWDAAVLKFVSKSIDIVNDEEWICALAAALGKQFSLYTHFLNEKKFLFKLLGVVLSRVKNAQFVVDHLDLMLRNVNHCNIVERCGCAQGLGHCASLHTDIVLTKLENQAKLEFQKKPTGLLAFLKDNMPMKNEPDAEMVCLKATIMLSFGYVVFYCPQKSLAQKLESIVLRFLAPYFRTAKEPVVKVALLKTIQLIASAIASNVLSTENETNFTTNMLNHIQDYVKSEPVDQLSTSLRIQASKALSALSKLDSINEGALSTTVSLMCLHTYGLNWCKSDVEDGCQVTMDSACLSLNSMLQVVLLKNATAERLTLLLKILQPWFSSDVALERQRSMYSACHLLSSYYSSADIVLGHATDFPLMGSLLGRFGPRFGDLVLDIRLKALECVHQLLAISVAHMGHGKDYRDSIVDGVAEYKRALEKADFNSYLSVFVQLSKVVDQRLPGKQIQNYLTVLFDLVLDKQAAVSTAAAILLKLQLTCKGEHLVSEAEKITSVLLSRLASVKSQSLQTYTECLLSLHEFSKFHLHTALTALLNQQLPFSESVCDCWSSLSRDHQMLPLILDHLLEVLAQESPFDPVDLSQSHQKYARVVPLAATAALSLVCSHLPESYHQQWFARLLVRLLLQLGGFAETALPRSSHLASDYHRQNTPSSIVKEALKSLLSRHTVSYAVDERTWTEMDDWTHYYDSVLNVAKAIGANSAELMEPVAHLLKESRASKIEGVRLVCAAVFAGFVRFCQQQSDDLVEMLVTNLMAGLVDTNLNVRKVSVRGMGYVSHCGDAVFEKYTQTVLSAMMAGLEDPTDHKDEVAFEAMQGLGRLTTRVSRSHIEKIMVYIMLRIKPCFEKNSGAVRAVAFSLFGNLARFNCDNIYTEQVHSNIVSVLLHLNDDVEEVRTACIFVMNSLSMYMKSSLDEKDHFEKVVGCGDSLNAPSLSQSDYCIYLKEATKFLVTFYVDRVNFYALCCANYLKSSSIRMRCNAASFLGHLLGNVPQEQRTTISKELLFTGLALLLKEPEPEIRLAVAEAAAHLYGY